MADAWFYSHNNERKGPVDLDSMMLLISSGTIKSNTLVWKKGMSEWSAAVSVAELKVAAVSPLNPARPSSNTGTKKASILPWLVGGGALLMLGAIGVVVLGIVLITATSGSHRAADQDDNEQTQSTGNPDWDAKIENQRRYNEQLNRDAKRMRDAFAPAK